MRAQRQVVPTVSSIVEGDGEVEALPIILRRLNDWYGTDYEIARPIRVKRNRFIQRESEFSRYIGLASHQATGGGFILLLLDADDDCPKVLGASLRERMYEQLRHPRFSVVLAKREFEAWFIAASDSLTGHRGFNATVPMDAESPRDAKGWIAQHMPNRRYSEIVHQPSFAAVMDLQMAYERSRSFRKLCNDWITLSKRPS